MSFELAHFLLPKKISHYAEKYNKPFLHVSSLGSSYDTKSNYLMSKKMGEEFIENNNTNYIIIRPSIVYGRRRQFYKSIW
jgi:NADH dehydrogenase